MAFKIANIVRTWFFTNTANCDFISTRNSAKSFEEHPENTANIEVVAKFEWGCHQVQGIFIKSSLSEIPGTNETNVEAIAPNSLIRFRGMVQDIFDPEFIWGSFELCSKRTHEKKHKFGCYADTSNCVKCVRIRSYSGPHFPAFRLNTEIWRISSYSVRMRESADQSNSEYGHFLRSQRYSCVPIPHGNLWIINIHVKATNINTKTPRVS